MDTVDKDKLIETYKEKYMKYKQKYLDSKKKEELPKFVQTYYGFIYIFFIYGLYKKYI
jgi:hypothetical protein